MSEIYSERSEFPSEDERLMPVDTASQQLRELAEPRPVGDTIKAAITRAANAMNEFMPRGRRVSYGRAEDIWRREARRIDVVEMDAIRAAHERRNRALREELRAAAALADRLERLAAQAIPSTDLAALDEVVRTAQQAKRTARALRDLASASERGA